MTEAFLGIRYAQPVDGARRWQPPVPRDDGQPQRDFAPAALQGSFPAGDLTALWTARQPAGADCLAVNVWTPDRSAAAPVLVLLHGGGLVVGDAAQGVYDGARLASRGLVVVTANYRLGYPGFLPFEDGNANRGLLDQVCALQWVQRHISEYGGDPTRVTVAGHSGGGSCVLALMAMPTARGLFSRAAALSPTQTPFVPLSAFGGIHARFAASLGVGLDDATSEQVSAATLATEAYLGSRAAARRHRRLAFRRSAVALVTDTPSLPEDPVDVLASRDDVPLLIGSTADEWRTYTSFVGTPVGRVATVMMLAATLPRPWRIPTFLRATSRGRTAEERTNAVMTHAAFGMLAEHLADAKPSARRYTSSWTAPGLDGRWGAGHGSDLPLWLDNLGGLFSPADAPDDPAAVAAAELYSGALTAHAKADDTVLQQALEAALLAPSPRLGRRAS